MTRTDEILSDNRVLAARLAGKRLTRVDRLAGPALETEPARAWGRVLLESTEGIRWLIDVDEGRRNIVLFDVTGEDPPPGDGRFLGDHLYPIVVGGAADPLGFVLEAPVRDVALISREPPPEFPVGYEMCGLRLGFGDAHAICIGTHLTGAPVVGVWVVTPAELEPAMRCATIAGVVS